MELFDTASGRAYTPLPIDPTRGFPQSFPVLFGGRAYRFGFHVNVAAERLGALDEMLELPAGDAFLVVRVEREETGGERETILLRKVVPGLEYECGDIALVFGAQRVARRNLNGQGDFGSAVTGGIASRWA
ncbi:MAG: hypothetical protein QOJ76_57 [Acidobacteriota bacterium]|jgi:hypothetical protein|nr:hypothetical protein [Acidobacteriota bacterium]